ncbi:WXG100 family type VII secretion target [Nocardia panacis]|uniref:WXG100 family type VII secretion target n=1 Tax=Nocardia panacis TaxID=2340916 RepID=A0A3A4KEF0_9NOCA|nr:WXG100 family type VII secretion target [Nocardia panacis]RJO71464.1 WXG100 family type VII secretion target [Nocardia panacis]
MAGFRLDPAALRATTPRFADTSQRVTSALADLQRVLDTEGECWGHDKPGAAFAKGYVDHAKQTSAGTANLAQILAGLGAQMTTIADSTQAQDRSAAEAIGKLTA